MLKIFIVISFAVAAIATISVMDNNYHPKGFFYNAYAPGYDEYFVIKSDHWLPLDTIVHFDDKATVTDKVTGYQARILSPYTLIH